MRIVFDHQIFSVQAHGGVSRYYIELARRFSARQGDDMKILAPFHVNSHILGLENGIVQGMHLPPIPHTRSAICRLNRLLSSRSMRDYRPNIVHETYYAAEPSLSGGRAKTVTTVHDMIHERFATQLPGRDRTATLKRKAVERADHVICVSETTKQDLLAFIDVNPDKVSVVLHGVEIPVPLPGNAGSPVAGPYLLYVGIRGHYKNFERLLRAYANRPALHENFRLVCFGGGKLAPAEHELRERLGLAGDRVAWIGGNDDLLTGLYRQAAAFVCPSLYEGFGMPLLEAMANDCPVVCSNGGAIPEVVGDAGELFDPIDESGIADAIERVVTTPARADALRGLGRNRAAHFSWDKCADETHRIYEALL